MQAITLEVILRVVFGVADGPRLERLRGLLRDLLDRNRLAARPSCAACCRAALRRPRPLGRGSKASCAQVDELLFAEIAEHRASGPTSRSATTSSRC